MQAHSTTTAADRDRGKENCKAELQGRLPKGPFEFYTDLKFDGVVGTGDVGNTRSFKQALRRDMRWAVAGGVRLRLHGFHNAMRIGYDGGVQLVDGGVI